MNFEKRTKICCNFCGIYIDVLELIATITVLFKDAQLFAFKPNSSCRDQLPFFFCKIASSLSKFKKYYEAQIKVVIESVSNDVKELRYLMNLMKKQLDGETEDASDCLICCESIDCFMVFASIN
nr:hypothetical protein T22D1.6 - Caenorhabditis elegans [Caenorhabditis elegans]